MHAISSYRGNRHPPTRPQTDRTDYNTYCAGASAQCNNIGWIHRATTAGIGEDWSPTFRLGTNDVLIPQLFGRIFQKARNFTAIVTSQVLSETQSFHITPHSANILVDIQPATDLALDMLVVCSDIHVLGSPLMSAEATRMRDLAFEFSKNFRG